MFYEEHGYFDKGIRCGDYFWNMLSMFLYCHLNNFGSCGHKNVQLLSLFLSLYKRVHIYVIRSRGKSTQIMSVFLKKIYLFGLHHCFLKVNTNYLNVLETK